jgi:tetratricopeptide (TPR) repeat protein
LFVAALVAAEPLAALEARVTADPENLRVAADYREAAIAAGDYARAITFLEALTRRPGAGPHAFLSLGLAYIDRIPAVGAFKRISLGNDATKALTRSIEREPTDVAYLIRGIVNLHFEKGWFHRTPDGVADLERALQLAGRSAEASRSGEASRGDTSRSKAYVARIYAALGDGYWQLKDRDKARATWREGQARFPGDERLRIRTTATDRVIADTIAHDLDASVRVDTSLHDLE